MSALDSKTKERIRELQRRTRQAHDWLTGLLMACFGSWFLYSKHALVVGGVLLLAGILIFGQSFLSRRHARRIARDLGLDSEHD